MIILPPFFSSFSDLLSHLLNDNVFWMRFLQECIIFLRNSLSSFTTPELYKSFAGNLFEPWSGFTSISSLLDTKGREGKWREEKGREEKGREGKRRVEKRREEKEREGKRRKEKEREGKKRREGKRRVMKIRSSAEMESAPKWCDWCNSVAIQPSFHPSFHARCCTTYLMDVTSVCTDDMDEWAEGKRLVNRHGITRSDLMSYPRLPTSFPPSNAAPYDPLLTSACGFPMIISPWYHSWN